MREKRGGMKNDGGYEKRVVGRRKDEGGEKGGERREKERDEENRLKRKEGL